VLLKHLTKQADNNTSNGAARELEFGGQGSNGAENTWTTQSQKTHAKYRAVMKSICSIPEKTNFLEKNQQV